MTRAAAFTTLLEAVGPRVNGLLGDVDARLAELVDDRDATVAEPALSMLRAGGKRLRPLLVLVCGRGGAADEAEREALTRAAVAVELVHMATLVHDDVLDRASTRRGRPTVYAGFGREAAIATGDLLFALAFGELAESADVDQVAALSLASSALARGELMQREDAWNIAVTRDRYLERCELKTGRLFEAAARLGALAGGYRDQAAALGEFGRRVGVAFQLADDVLDVVGDPAVTGKDRGTDLLDGTVNLPLIVARERGAIAADFDLRSVTSTDAAAELCDLIAGIGAAGAVEEEAAELIALARRPLDRLAAADRAVFELIAQQAIGRSV